MKLIKKFLGLMLLCVSFIGIASNTPTWVKEGVGHTVDGELTLKKSNGSYINAGLNQSLPVRTNLGRTPNIMVIPPKGEETFLESLNEGVYESINTYYSGDTPLSMANIFSLEGYSGYIEKISWSSSNQFCEGSSAIEIDGVTFYKATGASGFFDNESFYRFNNSINVYASNNPGGVGIPSGCAVGFSIKHQNKSGTMDTFISNLPKKTYTYFKKNYTHFGNIHHMSEVLSYTGEQGVLTSISWSSSNYSCSDGIVIIDGRTFNGKASFKKPVIFNNEIRIFAKNSSYGCGVAINGYSAPP